MPMTMRRLLLASLTLWPGIGLAQTAPTGFPTSGVHSGVPAPRVSIACGDDQVALPCGTVLNPLYVYIQGGGSSGGGTASTVAQGSAGTAAWLVKDAALEAALSNGALNVNFPTTQAVSGTFWQVTQPVSEASAPPGVATSTNQATQITAEQSIVTNTTGLATAAGQSSAGGSLTTIAGNTAARSGAWTDASAVITTTASTPVAAAGTRIGLHIWNVGTALACINWTSAATVSGSACGSGSVPIPAGSAYLEDQPGNVSPEAISAISVSATTLTIKVR